MSVSTPGRHEVPTSLESCRLYVEEDFGPARFFEVGVAVGIGVGVEIGVEVEVGVGVDFPFLPSSFYVGEAVAELHYNAWTKRPVARTDQPVGDPRGSYLWLPLMVDDTSTKAG